MPVGIFPGLISAADLIPGFKLAYQILTVKCLQKIRRGFFYDKMIIIVFQFFWVTKYDFFSVFQNLRSVGTLFQFYNFGSIIQKIDFIYRSTVLTENIQDLTFFFHAFKIFSQKRKHAEIFPGCIQMSTYERKLMNKQFWDSFIKMIHSDKSA